MTKEYTTAGEEQTEALGFRLGQLIQPGAVIAYTGDLGAGKTAFTRGLARGLGIPDELFDIGWEDYLARGGVCAVEWSENVDDALDDDAIRVDIRRGAQDDQRVISVTGGPDLTAEA